MEQSEHMEWSATRPEHSEADFCFLVAKLRAEAETFAEDIDAQAQRQLAAASLAHGCPYEAGPSARAALDEYVRCVSWAIGNFNEACTRVVLLLQAYDAEVDRIFGTDPHATGAHPVLEGAQTIRQLDAKVTALANRHADQVDHARTEFYTSWDAYVQECETQLTILRDSLAHAHALDACMLSQAAAESEHAGQFCLHGLSSTAGAALTVFTAASHRVQATLTTAWQVASAAQAVWARLTGPRKWQGGVAYRALGAKYWEI
ncbi:hypothetical protein AB0N09_39820 [Streptomyces erythrochromogenes]|uniref:hypothetical protein n=1 Tax=Streptomyces erythrochromogenes TaxID=285574 RepID=UPI0034196D3C